MTSTCACHIAIVCKVHTKIQSKSYWIQHLDGILGNLMILSIIATSLIKSIIAVPSTINCLTVCRSPYLAVHGYDRVCLCYITLATADFGISKF